MIYKVEEKNHYFLPHRFVPLINCKELTRNVYFDITCKYDLQDPKYQLDINKLFGIGYLPHHRVHSARFGWRWSVEKERIEIFCYIHSNGERTMIHLVDIKLGSSYKFKLKILAFGYQFIAYDNTGSQIAGISLPIKHKRFRALGYLLGPYFGGDHTAPQTMYIILTK